MTALNPRLIQDTIHLVETYQRSGEGSAFRRRFDMAIARNVNATYKYRPLKLYFEVLASINRAKYGEPYKDIRRLVVHDEEGIISKTLLKVNQNDLKNLYSAEKNAKEQVNSTDYQDQDIKDINHIEENFKNPDEKRKMHKERLDKLDKEKGFTATKKTVEAEDTAEVEEKTPQPASEEEKAIFLAPLSEHKEKNIEPEIPKEPESKFSPSKHDLVDDRRWSTRIRGFFRKGASGITEKTGATTITEGVAGGVVKTVSTRVGVRLAAGRAVATGLGKVAVKLGASTVAKAGAGIIAKLSISTILSSVFGIATGGVGFVVGIAITAITTIITTFSKQIKGLFKQLMLITVGLIAFIIFMFLGNWGMKMNSLLPPYTVGYAEPLDSTTPTPPDTIPPDTIPPIPPDTIPPDTITPIPPGTVTPTPPIPTNASSCPIPNGKVTCGSYFTPINGCGHCGISYLPVYRDAYCSSTYGGSANYTGTESGLDIKGDNDQAVYLPMINGQIVNWSFAYESGGTEAIQRYNGSSLDGQNSYVLQFHHTQAGSSNRSATKSGDIGARICTTNASGKPCGEYHVHVQLEAQGNWLDAAQYFCK